jgi:hypothetical protein
MHQTAAFIAIFAGILVSLFVPIVVTAMLRGPEQEKARKRRLADAKMNARLLRLNL